MKLEEIKSDDYIIEIDKDTSIYEGIDFDIDEVHAPDTSMFNGIFAGKIKLKDAIKAKEFCGMRFFKVVSKKQLKL